MSAVTPGPPCMAILHVGTIGSNIEDSNMKCRCSTQLPFVKVLYSSIPTVLSAPVLIPSFRISRSTQRAASQTPTPYSQKTHTKAVSKNNRIIAVH